MKDLLIVLNGSKKKRERRQKDKKKMNLRMNYNALQPIDTICQRKFRNLRKKPQKRVEWKEENERKKKIG